MRGTSRSLLPRRVLRLGADPPPRSAARERGRFGWRSLSRSSPISDVFRRSRGTANNGSDAAGSLLRHVHLTRADTHGGEPREPSPHVRWRFRPFARMNETSPSYRSGALSRPRVSALRVTATRSDCAPRTTLPSGGERSRDRTSRPRGDHAARATRVHEEPSSFCRRRGVLPPRVSHSREPAMRCVRPTCAQLWMNGQPSCRAVPEALSPCGVRARSDGDSRRRACFGRSESGAS